MTYYRIHNNFSRASMRLKLKYLTRILLLLTMLGSNANSADIGISINNSNQINRATTQLLSRNQGNGSECRVIDFEGIGNNVPIGTVVGTPDVIFGSSWLGLIDADAGGTGNFANEPSANTVAYFLDTVDNTINFGSNVQFVEVRYSASSISLPVTLTAYDGANGTGNIVDTITGIQVGVDLDGAICSGDPEGNFCAWHILSLTAGESSISSITLSGAIADQFAFDDMRFCPILDYVALGDSYSSGEGAENYVIDLNRNGNTNDPGENTDTDDNKCHRSSNAYSWNTITMNDIQATVFAACSGAVTNNVKPQGTPQDYSAPDNVTQLAREAINENTDLVTITIGGNDALFATVLRLCYYDQNCQNSRAFEGSSLTLNDYISQLIIDIVQKSVFQTMLNIKQSAPNAQIYLMGYPQLFPSSGSTCNLLTSPNPFSSDDGWSVDEQKWINGLAPKLNSALSAAAASAGIGFIPIDGTGLFTGHEICGTGVPWLREPSIFQLYKENPELFHPNALGHRNAYRRALESRLKIDGIGSNQRNVDTQANSKIAQLGASLPSISDLQFTPIGPVCETKIYGPNQVLDISGSEYLPLSQVTVLLDIGKGDINLGKISTDNNGSFSSQVTMPAIINSLNKAKISTQGVGQNSSARVSFAFFTVDPNALSDTDGDNILNSCDICPSVADSNQLDTDNDGIGDACDVCELDPANDVDNDGLCANIDPCPLDPTNDADLDGRCASIDNCPLVFNPNQTDDDGDLIGNACDICNGSNDLGCLFGSGFEILQQD